MQGGQRSVARCLQCDHQGLEGETQKRGFTLGCALQFAAAAQNAGMASTDHDDDPTHALDDFVRRMRQPADAPAPAPDLSGLHQPIDADAAQARPRSGVLRSGQRWSADDVEDVPVVELPRTPPALTTAPLVSLPTVDLPAELAQAAQVPAVDLPLVEDALQPDGAMLQAGVRGARDAAASQYAQDAQAASQPVWQPDPVALQLRAAPHPRLPAQWQPGAWVGALRQVFDASTEFVRTANGPAVETYAAHRLLLLWPPRGDAGAPPRWPQQAWLLSLPAAQERAAALAQVPGEIPLWLMPDTTEVDWALGAELVLHHQAGLRPFQIDGLRAFIDSERAAVFDRINAGYGQPVAPGPVQRR